MRKILLISVFISGMTSLAIEMSASRLLGNFFGTSNLVWASIIGLILIYLASGNFLGGFWADRSPEYKTFYKILLWAAFSTGIIPFLSRPILRFAADAFDKLQLGVLFGSFTTVLLLLCVPIILLGTASPFAIRLAVNDTKIIGRTSGKIYAISTAGSFVGTFLPVLILIPLIGTYRSFIVFCGVLMIMAFLGLIVSVNWRYALRFAWMPVLILIISFLGLHGTDKNTQGQIFETESAYNYIQVLEVNGFRYLRLNEGQGVHSVYHPQQLNYYGPWEMVLNAPFFNPAPYSSENVESMAILGLAAGTTARQALLVFDNISVDGVEIDPKIIEVGKQYFDMADPGLEIITQDARWALTNSDKQYQIISIDAYRPPYIPWHMTTREFFREVNQHLTDDGVMVINVGRAPDDRRLINALSATIKTEFPEVYIIDIPDTFNSIIYAPVFPTTINNLFDNYNYLASQENTHPLLLEALSTALTNIQPTPTEGIVFTDDKAPIEWMTNNMVLSFLFSGATESLQ